MWDALRHLPFRLGEQPVAVYEFPAQSYGIEVGDGFLLFDPLCVPDHLRERATAVVLTAPYHERDARWLGLPMHTPPADSWQDWVEKFGVDPDRVRGMESDDLADPVPPPG
jgi:hypothetical protein